MNNTFSNTGLHCYIHNSVIINFGYGQPAVVSLGFPGSPPALYCSLRCTCCCYWFWANKLWCWWWYTTAIAWPSQSSPLQGTINTAANNIALAACFLGHLDPSLFRCTGEESEHTIITTFSWPLSLSRTNRNGSDAGASTSALSCMVSEHPSQLLSWCYYAISCFKRLIKASSPLLPILKWNFKSVEIYTFFKVFIWLLILATWITKAT